LQQQWGNWVPGIEVSFQQFASLEGRAIAGGGVEGIEDQPNWTLMLTPRLGYAWDRWLGFVKAGYALTDVRSHEALSTGSNPFRSPVATTDVDQLRGGWVAGSGIDYALTDSIILGAEYQHIFVESATHTGDAPLPSPAFGNVKLQGDIDTVAARLNFKFYRETEAPALK